MGHALRLSLKLLGVVLLAVPLSIVTTILLFPMWSWVEASTGFESVGHAGPAQWCYAAVFLFIAASGALIVLIRDRAHVDEPGR